MQSLLQGASSSHKPYNITTVIIDEVHNRSAQSDYALALTLAAMQMSGKTRLVLMSATGDSDLVKNQVPRCQKVVLSGAMHKIGRIFLSQPTQCSDRLLFSMAQIIIARHSNRAGRALVDHT